MWDNYEEVRSERPYLWLALVVLLVLLGSIFVFRPSIREQPSAGESQVATELVLTTVNQAEPGLPVLTSIAPNGIWTVHISPQISPQKGQHLVRFLNPRGSEQWVDTAPFSEAVIGAQGNFLAIAGLLEARVFVYHVRHQLVSVIDVPGEVQGVAVSEQGEVLVTFTIAAAEPLKLRTEIAKYSSQGQQMWRQSLHNELPLLSQKAANGEVSAIANITLGARVGAMLTVLGRNGETILRSAIAGQPRHLLVASKGERVVLGTAAGVHSFDLATGKRAFYEIPGVLTSLSFLGESGDLFFSAKRQGAFNRGIQTVLGVLSNGQRLVWQQRIDERALFVSVSQGAPALLLGTATHIMLYTAEGQEYARIKHSFGDNYLAVNLEGVNDIILSGTGQVVQLSIE